MDYEFPYITNISDILPAIAGREEFIVAEKEGYTVINYQVMFEDTFPVTNPAGGSAKQRTERSLHAKLRRECRGIIFDTATGEIIRRPFHKFFNVNEREETQDHRINLSKPHAILEKLDGSMIVPFVVNGKMIWGTKMGATGVAEPVETFVERNPKYKELAEFVIANGDSPIFEWCSRKQRIVLDYGQEDQLILTAVRHMRTGEYSVHEGLVRLGEKFDIPVVRAFEPQSDMREFLKYVHDLQDLEGFVVRFNDGHMIKLKCHWYVQIHKAKEAILQDRNIVELILEDKLDDIKGHLDPADRDRLSQFEGEFNFQVLHVARSIEKSIAWVQGKKMDRKTFALEHAQNFDGFARPLIFKNFDEVIDSQKIEADVRNVIRNNLGKTVKYEAIRDTWFPGVAYNV